MKEFPAIVVLLAAIASSNAIFFCLEGIGKVCGRESGTNNCRAFNDICALRRHNNYVGPYMDQVEMTMCPPNSMSWAQPCNDVSGNIPTPPSSTQCDPNKVCTPLATTNTCTYQATQVPQGQELCRTFRNECELEKYNCGVNSNTAQPQQPTFALADPSRCTGLTETPAACT